MLFIIHRLNLVAETKKKVKRVEDTVELQILDLHLW